jgi:hypothetical protein
MIINKIFIERTILLSCRKISLETDQKINLSIDWTIKILM